MVRWLWLCLALVASIASAGRLTTFAWDAGADWPPGTTVELCGNGDVCMTGLTGTQATLDLPVNPGEMIQGRARAIPPTGYQCGNPLELCQPSIWSTVAATWPAVPVHPWAYQEEDNQMAIVPASGTYYGTHDPNSNAMTGSFDITVPADADCLIVYVSTYVGTTNGLTSGSYGVTAEGNTRNATANASASVSYYQGAGYLFLNPPTGSGVTIAWSFQSSAYNHQFAWVAYKGVGSVRGTYGNQADPPPSIEFTASSGDVISVAIEQYYSSGATSATWTNATKILDSWDGASSLLSLADASPSGNVTISAVYVGADGGLMGFVLVPSAAASLSLPPHIINPMRTYAPILVR